MARPRVELRLVDMLIAGFEVDHPGVLTEEMKRNLRGRLEEFWDEGFNEGWNRRDHEIQEAVASST